MDVWNNYTVYEMGEESGISIPGTQCGNWGAGISRAASGDAEEG